MVKSLLVKERTESGFNALRTIMFVKNRYNSGRKKVFKYAGASQQTLVKRLKNENDLEPSERGTGETKILNAICFLVNNCWKNKH